MPDRKDELIQRVGAKVKVLEAQLAQLRADTTGNVNDQKESLQKKVNDMKQSLEEATNNFSESVAKKLNDWLQ